MNREAVYDEKISPLMSEIIRLCKEHDIPMVASFQYDDRDGSDVSLCSTAILNQNPPPCEALLRARHAIVNKPSNGLMVTTRDGDGNVTRMDAIFT